MTWLREGEKSKGGKIKFPMTCEAGWWNIYHVVIKKTHYTNEFPSVSDNTVAYLINTL
jgi:hypothetical protein